MKTGILILLTSLVWNLQLSGQTIPENVTLKQLDGKEITFNEAVQQGPVIVSFWATWCKPCQSELEALKDLEDSWKNKVRIIAVSIDDARAMAKVKSLVKGKKWPFEVLLDPNKELYKAFNISAIPHVLVINDKKVVWTHSGYMPGNEVLVVDKALETLPEQTRDIFIRSRYNNQSHKDIAEALGVSTKTVEFHITKALKVLRVALKDYFPLLAFIPKLFY